MHVEGLKNLMTIKAIFIKKAQTVTKYARQAPKAEINIEDLVQKQKFLLNSKSCSGNQNVDPNKWKITKDGNENKNCFSQKQNSASRIFKNSGIKIELILV